MTRTQHATTTVQVQVNGRTILECIMRKLPSSRKYYRVTLIVSDNGIPIIEYQHTSSSKKPKKSIQFVDLLFADKKHDTNEKFAFSLYTMDKTVTFLAQDETSMHEWLARIKERHSELYPNMRYDAIFEANLLDKDLAKAINVRGPYRLALCKDSLDLIPVLTASQLLSKQERTATNPTITNNTTEPIAEITQNNKHQPQDQHYSESNLISSNTAIVPHANHHHLPQHLPQHKRNHKLWKYVTIELAIRTIRRCGHTDSIFYVESGRQSRIGAGGLWMNLNKKSSARQLHELLLATMKLTSASEDQFICKQPRSRSGSSNENAHRAQQSLKSSLICLTADPACAVSLNATINNNNSTKINSMEDDNGYLHMA